MQNNKILIFIVISSFLFSSFEKKLAHDENKAIRQAKSLQKSGLHEEALNLYYNIFNENPHLYEPFYQIKKILINSKNYSQLNIIADKYLSANKFSIAAKIDVFDIYLITNNIEWKNILNELIKKNPFNEKQIKKLYKIMLKNNFESDLLLINNVIREKEPDFYSLEMGIHYSLNRNVEKSLDEFILHLEHNPNKLSFVSNRILSFADIPEMNNRIISHLNNTNNDNCKILLSKIKFKNKKYQESYRILLSSSNHNAHLISFIEDLIKVERYEQAQDVISYIFNNKLNDSIMKEAIFLLAQIFEKMLINQNYGLNLSKHIIKNDLIQSPFVKVDPNKNLLLDKAIAIYDSLRINTNDVKAMYHLAEIKYKILGDLDTATSLYYKIYKNKSKLFYKDSIERTIDIMISKGQLKAAIEFISNIQNSINDKDLLGILDAKIIQIFYYQNNPELENSIDTFLTKNEKNHKYFNDVLEIKNNILFLKKDSDFSKYTMAHLKIYQNKRTEAIELLETLFNSNNLQINNKMKFECAYQNFLHNNLDKTITLLNEIDKDSAFKEKSIILLSEIYDYILNNKSAAVDLYLEFLDLFPNSIYYDMVRMRLRELAS